MSKNFWGTLLVLLSATCFAAAAIIIKFAYTHGLSSWQMLVLQSLSASFILSIFYFIYPNRPSFSWKTMLPPAIQGAIGSLGTSLAFFLALQYVDASLASVLLYTYPVFVTLGGVIFLKHRLLFNQVLALALTLVGVLMVMGIFFGIGSAWHVKGILLGLASGVTYAFYNLFGEVVVANNDSFVVTAVNQFASTIMLLLIKPGVILTAVSSGMFAWSLGALLAVLTSIIPFFLLLQGIKFLGATRSAIISTFELPVTMLLSYLFLKESITGMQLVGAALVLSGIIILQGFRQEETCKAVKLTKNL